MKCRAARGDCPSAPPLDDIDFAPPLDDIDDLAMKPPHLSPARDAGQKSNRESQKSLLKASQFARKYGHVHANGECASIN